MTVVGATAVVVTAVGVRAVSNKFVLQMIMNHWINHHSLMIFVYWKNIGLVFVNWRKKATKNLISSRRGRSLKINIQESSFFL